MKFMNSIKSAFFLAIAMFILCGFVYPLFMTGLAQVVFPHQANGSLIEVDGQAVGSTWVGQDFTDVKYFHGRPSAVKYNTYEDKADYQGLASGSENLAVSNPKLEERIEEDIEKFLKENPGVKREDIPEDIITASGSGLDPHISPRAAYLQVDRIAENTGLEKSQIESLIEDNVSGKILGIFGEEKVNVLELNLSIVKELEKSI